MDLEISKRCLDTQNSEIEAKFESIYTNIQNNDKFNSQRSSMGKGLSLEFLLEAKLSQKKN